MLILSKSKSFLILQVASTVLTSFNDCLDLLTCNGLHVDDSENIVDSVQNKKIARIEWYDCVKWKCQISDEKR